jgi:aryl-alcohol dehydrogenase-like predicted oxidoreductase
VKAGKVRAFGASNLDATQLQASFDASDKAGLPRYAALQPEYNLYDRAGFEGPLADLCLKEGLGVITYFSLAAGFLTGKYRTLSDTEGRARGEDVARYLDERGLRILAALDRMAAETGATPAELSLAWLMAKPAVTAPIASATSLSQLASLTKAASLSLSADQVSVLDRAGA